MKLINWARTKLSQEHIPLLDNGYGGESLWSSFFIKKINGVNTLLTQEPIPLLDNGYGGESLWSSLLWKWSTEPGTYPSPRPWIRGWVFMFIFFIEKISGVRTKFHLFSSHCSVYKGQVKSPTLIAALPFFPPVSKSLPIQWP